jgi:hypothetical protein
MKIEKNKYPIFLLEELEDVIIQLRKTCKNYSWMVSEKAGDLINPQVGEANEAETFIEKEYELVRFAYKDNSKFLFTIDEIELEDKAGEYRSLFNTYRSPKNDKSVLNETVCLYKQEIIDSFKDWIQILERYNKVRFQDPIIEQYEDEIFAVMKIVDKDADKSSFDTEQQIFMLNYLENAQKYIEAKKDQFETAEIIEEIKELKKDVTSLTKNASMRRLSTMLAKVKKQGMHLFKDLMVMFKKELMKKVLTGGFDAFDKLATLLQSLN